MNKPTRILTAILVSLLLGGMFAYQDAQKNKPPYQQHPVVCIATDFFGGSLSGLIFYFGSGWLARRKERKLKQPENDKYYDEVARELETKSLRPGLWTRAVAETGDEGSAAKALYIRLRVSELVKQEQTDRASSQAEARRKADEQRRAAKAAKPPILWYVGAGIVLFGVFCGLLTIFFSFGLIAGLIDMFSKAQSSGLTDDLAGELALLLVFCGGLAVFFGWATYRSFKEIL
jgi:hypothetical protein